jgi:hypothetical protein
MAWISLALAPVAEKTGIQQLLMQVGTESAVKKNSHLT